MKDLSFEMLNKSPPLWTGQTFANFIWSENICCGSILSLVQILFPLFQTHYHQITIAKTKEIKFEPRIKLNHNIYTLSVRGVKNESKGNIQTFRGGLYLINGYVVITRGLEVMSST